MAILTINHLNSLRLSSLIGLWKHNLCRSKLNNNNFSISNVISTSHLDGTSGSSHADKVLPLQDGPESALQRDDASQDLLMEERLKTLALSLPQEHLKCFKRHR